MPLKGLTALLAITALIMTSGCSLAAKQWVEANQGQIEQVQEKQVADEDSREVDPNPDTEEEPEAVPPNNRDSGGGTDDNQLEASNITLMVDDRNWQKVGTEQLEPNHEYTEFTPEGQPSEVSRELLGVHFFKGLHQQLTVAQAAEVLKQGMEEESQGGEITWNPLAQNEKNMLVEIALSDDPQNGSFYGYIRCFSTDDGIYALLYMKATPLSDEEQEKWQSLLKQADQQQLVL
ncbi:MAG: hypothetical protein M0Z65_05185 [Firmicutes bacterium]|nr:hypothetical protein [Bacillota bacterium]